MAILSTYNNISPALNYTYGYVVANTGDSVNVTVYFGGNVAPAKNGGSIALDIDIGGTIVQATSYLTADNIMWFAYTIPNGTLIDTNGVSIPANALHITGNAQIGIGSAGDILDSTTTLSSAAVADDKYITVNGTYAQDVLPIGTATATLVNGTEDTPYIVSATDLLAGFSDSDGDTLTISSITPDHGTATNNNDGTWTITPELNYIGAVSLNYVVSDGQGGTVNGTQTFTLDAVNDPPTVTATDPNAISETDAAVTASGTFTGISDSGVDVISADVMSVSVAATTNGSDDSALLAALGLSSQSDVDGFLNSFTLNADGSSHIDTVGNTLKWDFTPGDAFNKLGVGQSLAFTYATQFTDSKGASTNKNVVITINGTNDAPVVDTPLSTQTVMVGNTFADVTDSAATSIPLANAFLDVDQNDTLTYSISAVTKDGIAVATPAWLHIVNGAIEFLDTDNTTNNTFKSADVGSYNISVIATDSQNAVSTANTFDFTVTPLPFNAGTLLASDVDYNGTASARVFNGDPSATAIESVTFSNESAGVTASLATGTGSNSGGRFSATFTFSGIDNLIGSQFGDSLTGDAGANVLYGQGGNDILDGGLGNDTLYGGLGDDTLTGGAGSDTFYVDSGSDTITDLGVGNVADVLIVSSGATATATATGNFTATSGTVNAGTASINASGHTVDLTTVTGTNGWTITNSGSAATLTGSTFSDSITGGASSDLIIGGDGNDTITGGAGNDTLTGGAGSDTFNVDSSTDTITDLGAGGVADILVVSTNAKAIATVTGTFVPTSATSNSGIANINASGHTVDLTAVTGTNGWTITNSGAAASISGSTAADTITGGTGNDTITGGAGNDTLTGGAGSDTFNVDSGTDTITDLGAGGVADILVVSANNAKAIATITGTFVPTSATSNSGTASINANGNTVDLTAVTGTNGWTITNSGAAASISGSTAADTITGGTGNDSLVGGAGNDSLVGGAGNDTLNSGAGNDTLVAGVGDDTYIVDAVTDVVIEGSNAGVDLVQSSVSYTLPINVEKLTLMDVASAVSGTGNNLNNTIVGNSYANTLDGGTGADTLDGGAGNDTYIIDNVLDSIINEPVGTGAGYIDSVFASVTYTLPTNIENLTLTGRAVIDGTGNDLANNILGNISANLLTGGAGNDSLNGADGNDTLDGGIGQDTLTGGTGTDTFRFTNATDTPVATPDLITDFDRVSKEKIDLSLIDANPAVNGVQAFTFIGTSQLTGAGQLHYVAATGNNPAYVEGSVDATQASGSYADFKILVTGIGNTNITALIATDFIL